MRGRAAEILIEMGPAAAAAVPKLTRALADPQVRDEALKALAGLGPTARAAVPTLYTLLWSADDDVRVRAYDALQQVRAKGPAPAAK